MQQSAANYCKASLIATGKNVISEFHHLSFFTFTLLVNAL